MFFKNFLSLAATLIFCASSAQAAEKFDIVVRREACKDGLISGTVFVNGKPLGPCHENEKLCVQPGKYKGLLRYSSAAGHVTGPFGTIGKKGDFLLEISGVKWTDGKKRSHILFHGGTKPKHSKGCVLLGPVHRDGQGKRYLKPESVLRKLRLAFYGTETPNSTPNKQITITIQEHPLVGSWTHEDGTFVVTHTDKAGYSGQVKGESAKVTFTAISKTGFTATTKVDGDPIKLVGTLQKSGKELKVKADGETVVLKRK